MHNRILIIGEDEFYKSLSNKKTHITNVITYYKAYNKDEESVVKSIQLKNFVKGNLGLKDVGLIINDCLSNDVLIVNYDVSEDRDSKRALQIIINEINIPIIFIGVKSFVVSKNYSPNLFI